ncbi:MAG: TraX family protein [Faecousia sp.]
MPFSFLTGNALKILAAIFMTIDHIGVLLFPGVVWLRVLGRLALPIFAFMIAEGCKYTRNRRKYFGMVFGLGVVCQTVYYVVDGSQYFSILITFSLAILMIYALQYWKQEKTPVSVLIFAGTVAAVWWLNRCFTIDYGFWGCMLPVFAALPHGTEHDTTIASTACLGAGLILLAGRLTSIQIYALFALPLLLCYNGKRGKANLKYFFYIFYPAHLVILEGIRIVMDILS